MSTVRLPMGWTVRPATIEDAEAVSRLFNATSLRFAGTSQTTEDAIRAWMSRPRIDLNANTRLVLDDSGHPAAWAHIRDPGEPYVNLGTGLHVASKYKADPVLWDALCEWCEVRASEYIAKAPSGARVALGFSGFAEDEPRWDVLRRRGATQVRILNRMRIDLHGALPCPAWPVGIEVRTYRHDDDLRSLVAAVQEAFADHWGFVETPLEEEVAQWRDRLQANAEQFDPSLWFVAVDGEELVGFSLCSNEIGGDSSRSELDPLGVRKPWRGRGIGLGFLHHAFRELQSRGMQAVELEVDSESLTGATRLYERAGMRVIRSQYLYEKELRAGTDLMKRG